MRALVAALAFAGALWLGGGELWLAAKGAVAARRIDLAFTRHLDDGERHTPWPWADTAPIAELRVPRLGVRRVVLSGATGATLAFGPGHIDGTAAPGTPGHSAIAGHRDSWFAFLEELEPGDRLQLRTLRGTSSWQVVGRRVVDHRDTTVLEASLDDRLSLITCWPFGALTASRERYVVELRPSPSISVISRAPRLRVT